MTKYGETHPCVIKNTITGEVYEWNYTYRRAEWHDWHTNNQGEGLWHGDRQILGTCQFGVTGCSTLKSATDKIRRYVKAWES